MLAVRLHRFGPPEVLAVESIPEPRPGPKDLLVRVEATSLNRYDLRLRAGEIGYGVPLPAIPGIDVCGTVIAVGNEVEAFAIGDRVTNSPWLRCGGCGSCRADRGEFCTGGHVYQGSYAELAVVPARIAVRVPAEIPATVLACLPNCYVTAWHTLVGRARVAPNDVVFVWAGSSGLGSAAVDIAKLAGARVATTAGTDVKLAAVRRRGADLCLDHRSPDLVARVMEFTDGLGASIVFEHVGEQTWDRSVRICAPGGMVVAAGATTGRRARLDLSELYRGQRSVLGSRTGTRRDLIALVGHAAAGRLNPLVDSVVPLEHAADGHRRLEGGHVVGKVVLSIGPQEGAVRATTSG